jgi:DNA-binding transcriptional ArsR family regulator
MNVLPRLDPDAMRLAADEASAFLKALSNPHRLMIICQLINGEKSVGQLADSLQLRDSTASQHLALLRRDRIISGRRDGQTIWYRIASKPALDVMQVLYAAYCAGSKSRHPASQFTSSRQQRSKE